MEIRNVYVSSDSEEDASSDSDYDDEAEKRDFQSMNFKNLNLDEAKKKILFEKEILHNSNKLRFDQVYQIQDKIGKGSFGKVYKVLHLESG